MVSAGGDHVRSFKMDPQVFAGSKPEQRARDARDGSLAHFVYTRDGDNGGLIYWLGTRRCFNKQNITVVLCMYTMTAPGLKSDVRRV